MNPNNIACKPIQQLLGCHFYIPSYQRGYRWKKAQVLDLLEDIWEFANPPTKPEGAFYCLQPIIVKKRDNVWEVIDGQQRLTTILIILTYFNNTQCRQPKKVFDLTFETRKDILAFLQTMDETQKDNDIDCFHIWNAYIEIERWFETKESENAAIANQFHPVLINDTQIIWYEITDDSEVIDIFTRINIGKIPLTNAELIKALFLSSSNFGENSAHILNKQLEIAGEWDRIEYALQNDLFWLFLNKENNTSPTRISFILDLMAVEINDKLPLNIEPKNNDYFAFMVFNAYFKQPQTAPNIAPIDAIWTEIKEYFMTFEEWFEDKKLFHWIGFLILYGHKIQSLKQVAKGKNKPDFRQYLRDTIKQGFEKIQLDNLEYGTHNEAITKVLLLFNLQTLLNNKDKSLRFRFDTYKAQKWSLEHIHAQQSKGLSTKNQWKSWLNDHIQALKRIDNNSKYAELIAELEKNEDNDKLTQELFEGLFTKVIKIFNEMETGFAESKMHTLQNLTLLDSESNSALNNSIFEVKTQLIKNREKTGVFIPICTRNVFLKYYTPNPSQLYFWSETDRNAYLQAIKDTLSDFLPTIHTETDAND